MSQTPSLEAMNLEIRVLMVRRKVTQKDLAEALAIGQPQVARRLSGEIWWKFSDLVTIADLLGLSLPDLIALSLPPELRASA